MPALFNFGFDFAAKRKAKEDAAKLEAQQKELLARAALTGTNASDKEVADFVQNGPDIEGLRGVTGTNPQADLQTELRNEEFARASTDNAPVVESLRRAVLLHALGVNPAQAASASNTDIRSRALREVLPQLAPTQQVNAANKLDVSPVRSSGGIVFNRFTGDFTQSDALDALAEQRHAAAGLSTAMAGDVNFRAKALEDLLSIPTSPVLAADIINKKGVSKPTIVKVRRKDGSEQLFNATRNQQGGYDYSPATADGTTPLIAEPDPTGSDSTPLQKDTAFIVQTLKIPPNEALLYKLQSKRKDAAQAWSDLVSRLVSAQKYDDPADIQQKAEQVWAVMRPGEPVPTSAPTPSRGGTAPSGGSAYPSDQAVKAAFRAGTLTRDEAMSILRRDFGYE